jgi:hypothetical protein
LKTMSVIRRHRSGDATKDEQKRFVEQRADGEHSIQRWEGGFPSLTGGAFTAMLGCVDKPFGIQEVTSRAVVSMWAVLDGEVAVPCNPQAAIAGFNSLLRYRLFGNAAG